ncbi:hypothetical protein FVF58_16135 [Paraburkholderia panacisoli]|uniref:Uncharacterized protein n=1 Tax=Paraburkholderia panacisoli TaxID=2603818 RepID=A0A5B0H8W4_9BURK|nr:hypothetical protein [Paraburkholderia panacisoli]KAA1011443.1 hypothetical protein FVF58_16135 [Paraburkholderia panacisoli]
MTFADPFSLFVPARTPRQLQSVERSSGVLRRMTSHHPSLFRVYHGSSAHRLSVRVAGDVAMIESADVVVIRSGWLGAAIAYYLAKRGTLRVALFEWLEAGS